MQLPAPPSRPVFDNVRNVPVSWLFFSFFFCSCPVDVFAFLATFGSRGRGRTSTSRYAEQQVVFITHVRSAVVSSGNSVGSSRARKSFGRLGEGGKTFGSWETRATWSKTLMVHNDRVTPSAGSDRGEEIVFRVSIVFFSQLGRAKKNERSRTPNKTGNVCARVQQVRRNR